jgi:hypothetical protein
MQNKSLRIYVNEQIQEYLDVLEFKMDELYKIPTEYRNDKWMEECGYIKGQLDCTKIYLAPYLNIVNTFI